MILNEQEPAFKPVVITLDCAEDVYAMSAIVTYVYNNMTELQWASFFDNIQAGRIQDIVMMVKNYLSDRI